MTARPGYVWDGTEWVLISGSPAPTIIADLRPEDFGAVGDGVTLTSTELVNQTEARLGSVSHTGERIIELNFTNQTLNCTGVVTQGRSPRSTGNASGAMEIAGRIQWYQSGYSPLTQVRVFNVGGNNFNYVRVWIYGFPTE